VAPAPSVAAPAFAPANALVASPAGTPEVVLKTEPASAVLSETVTLEAEPIDLPAGTVSYAFAYQEAEVEEPGGAEAPWIPLEPLGSDAILEVAGLPGNGLYNLRVTATVAGKEYVGELRDRLRDEGGQPLVTLGAVRDKVRGTIELEATVPRAEAPQSVEFQWEPADSPPGEGAWRAAGGPVPVPAATGSYSVVKSAFDTTSVADGEYSFRVVPFYGEAGTEPGLTIPERGVLIDNTPPAVTMLAPDSPLSGSDPATLEAQAGDPPPAAGEPSSGVATVAFQARSEAAAGAWVTVATTTHTGGSNGQGPAGGETYAASIYPDSLQSGTYEFRAIAEDLVGNVTVSAAQKGVTVDNSGLAPVVTASISGVTAPAQEVHFLGTIAAGTPRAETWAYGFTSAPPAKVGGNELEYTAVGGQLVLLRYTEAGGWQIAEVPEEQTPSGDRAFALLKPSEVQSTGANEVKVDGAMTPSGEAWLWVAEASKSGGERVGLFHRAAGAGSHFLLDSNATATLRPLLGAAAEASITLGQSPDGAYGMLVAPGQGEEVEEEPQGSGQSVAERVRYGLLQDGAWTLNAAGLTSALASSVKPVTLKVGALDGPGEGWGAFQRSDIEPKFKGQGLILGRLRNGSWTFPATGSPALDLTGVDTDALGTVEPKGLYADGASVWVEASVALPPEQPEGHRVLALLGESPGLAGTVQVDRSWCTLVGSPAVEWSSCGEPLGRAVVPQAIFDVAGEPVALADHEGFVNIFEHGRWTSVAAPGFGAAGAGASDFTSPNEGWVAGADALGLWSSEARTSLLASWPLPDRSTLTSVALPPGSSGTAAEAGALTVGFKGTALSYEPGTGWQVNPVPARARHANLLGVAFAGPGSAFAVGQFGTILHWNGSSWSEDRQSSTLTGSQLNGVAFSSSGEGWAVGADGTILHYDGSSWTSESVPAEDVGVSVTSVAVAGSEAFAIVGGELIVHRPGGSWEPASFEGGVEPAPESLRLVAGLADGGLVVAGRSVLLFRQQAGGAFEYAPQPLQGIAVALAPFRQSDGQLRTYVSIAPTADANTGNPAGDGELLRQTEDGWQDLSRSQYAGGGTAGDGAVKSDPVLAVTTGANGEHAWAAGGYDGTRDAAGQGTAEPVSTRSEGWQTASLWRYDIGGSEQSPANGATVAPSLSVEPGTVSFAFFTSPLCRTDCSAVPDAQPDVNLTAAAHEIATYAEQQGGPAFAMLGGNAVGPVETTAYEEGEDAPRDFTHLGEELAPLGGLATFAAAGPFDRVPRQPSEDALRPWAEAFADAPAPFGTGQDAGSIAPVSGGATEHEVHRYYSFEASQNGGTVLVIVLDDSARGGLEAGETAWLRGQLEANAALQLPVVVISGRPLRKTAQANLTGVAELLTEPRWNGNVVAVFSTNGASPRPFKAGEVKERDERRLIPEEAPPEAPQIPEYEGATLGYQEAENNGVTWYLASVDTQVHTVSVAAVPIVESLDLKAVDGLTVPRSRTLQFEAIARRPAATLATQAGEESPAFPGFDDYVQIPAPSCGTCVEPSYTFTSSEPAIGTFVAATGVGSPYPKLNSKGHPVASSSSGLFCGYNPGTTVVTVTAGLLTYSETVTVEAGSVGEPCGTVPPPGAGKRTVLHTARSTAGAGAAPPAAPPTALAGVNPVITAVPPAPAATVAKAPVPQPQPSVEPTQVPIEPAGITPALVPATTAPVEPIPPGSGGYAQSPSAAERREKARKHASQSAFVTRPQGVSGAEWFYGALALTTLLLLCLTGSAIRGGSRGRPVPAFNRSPVERERERRAPAGRGRRR
jgi:hypothetical protein